MERIKIWLGKSCEKTVDGELLQVLNVFPEESKPENVETNTEILHKWICLS